MPSHRSASGMADPLAVKAADDVDIYPDFLSIAKGYRVRAERVCTFEDLQRSLPRMLAEPNEPYLLDVIVNAEENVYPMIPAGGSYRDCIMG